MLKSNSIEEHEDYHLLKLPDSQCQVRTPSKSPPSSPPVLARSHSPARNMSSNSKEGSQEELSAAKSETSKEEGGLDAYAVKISASQADGTLMNDVPEAPVSEASAAEKDEQLMSMPPPEPKQAARKQQMPTPQEQPDSSDSTIPGPADADRSATPELPDQQIVDFDWTDLETQYHNRIRELEQHEIEIMKEFDDLIKVRPNHHRQNCVLTQFSSLLYGRQRRRLTKSTAASNGGWLVRMAGSGY